MLCVNSKFHPEKRLLAALAIIVCASFVLIADTLTGELRGTVLDVESKMPMPGAAIILSNTARGWKKQMLTITDGGFIFIQLEPGVYSVTAEKEGFYPSERTDILVRLNQPKVVIPPIELRRLVSTPTQQITVRGEQTKIAVIDLTTQGPNPTVLAYLNEPGFTSMISLLNGTLSSNFDTDLIERLPLRGSRSFDQLALLSPGVFRVPSASGDGPAVGIGVGAAGQFSVNGARGRSNNFTVDGSDNNDEEVGMRRQGFVALVPQSAESVREFQVITAGFTADFGRNSGGMVNAISRSGEQDLHGSLYGLFSPRKLRARSFVEMPYSDSVNAADLNGGAFSGMDSITGNTAGLPAALF